MRFGGVHLLAEEIRIATEVFSCRQCNRIDAVLQDDPYGRVACETLVTTGLAIIAGGAGRSELKFNRTNAGMSASMLALAVVLIRIYPTDEGRVETVRSFYGVHKIVETSDRGYHYLLHGTTIHGAQKWGVPGRPEPISSRS